MSITLHPRYRTLLAALAVTACADSGGGSTTPDPDAATRPQDGGPGGAMIPSGDMGGSTGGDPVGGSTGGSTGGDPVGGNTGGDPVGGSTGGDPVGGNTGGDPVGGSTGGNTGGEWGGSGGGGEPADAGLPPDLQPDVPPPPDLGRLVINEIDYDQVSADEAEYLEILNVADAPARLRGKALELVNGSNRETYATFDLGLAGDELAPGGYLVIGAQSVLDALPEGTLGLVLEGGIQNGAPDGARLVDTLDGGRFIDGVAWEGSLAGVGEGNGAPGDVEAGPGAIGRCPDGTDTDDNNADFVQIVGSPGAVNVCPPPSPRVMMLEIAPAEVPARSPFTLTVTIDLPAGPDGLPLVFDFTPAAGARGPEVGLIDAGEVSATFDFFAGAEQGDVEVVVESPELELSAEGMFTIVAPLPVERVPLVINEVDVDQPGADDAEFVEIHNPTDRPAPLVALSLQLVNGATGAVYERHALDVLGETLPPGGYLVVAAPELVAELPADVPAIALGGSILNDAGHAVRLVDELALPAVVLDAVAFGSDPGALAEGAPTRVRDTGADAALSVARCPNGVDTDDNAADFAFAHPTVGTANDCLPPLALSLNPAQVLSGGDFEARVELDFAAPAGGTPLTLTFEPAGGTCAIDPSVPEGARRAVVACSAPDAPGDYLVRVEGDGGTADALLVVGALPPPLAHPVINEVDYDQPGADDFDFVEIFNPTADDIALAPFALQVVDGSGGAVLDELALDGAIDTLPAGGYLVVGMPAVLALLPDGLPTIALPGGLQNGPDAVRLVARRGGAPEVVDGLAYEAEIAGAGEGAAPVLVDTGDDLPFSLSRCPNGADTDDNNDDFRLGVPSPGAANTCPAPLAAAAAPADPIVGEAVVLTVSLAVPRVGGDLPLEVIVEPAGGLVCPADPVLPDGARRVELACNAGAIEGAVTITVRAGGAEAETAIDVQPAPPARMGLLINEIDPDQPGGDGAEFYELFNPGNAPMPLDGLAVELVNGATNAVYATIDLSAAGAAVPAGGFLVVTREQAILDLLPAGVLGLRNGAALQNDADGLRLVDQNTGNRLDGMSYGIRIPNVTEGTFAPNDNGFVTSLSRCPDGRDTDDNARDFAFAEPTPGRPNACAP
ncbi:hypothetical protein L6V77_14985 [Myxococcota bacterium]|nr:hypothetical protein [Myxococcota bacterium]